MKFLANYSRMGDLEREVNFLKTFSKGSTLLLTILNYPYFLPAFGL